MAKEFKRYLVTSALPYANGPVHIGHLAGVYIPSDIYTRYLRLKGCDVISVCGSDEHGVPITIKARKEGVTPQQIVDRYHNLIKKSFEGLGMSFDIYSRTSSATHAATASEFFRKLYDEGKFIEKTTMQYYDEEAQSFHFGPSMMLSRGKEEALKVLDRILCIDKSKSDWAGDAAYTDPDSVNTFMQVQTKYFSGGSAMMVNGDWLENEVRTDFEDELASGELDIRYMAMPVISSLGEKLGLTDAQLSAAVEYVRNDGEKPAISDDALTAVADARKINQTLGVNHNAVIPCYAKAEKLAKDFLVFMASDAAQEIYLSATKGAMLPFDYDAENSECYAGFSPFQKSKFEVMQGSKYVFNQSKHPLFYRGGVTPYSNLKTNPEVNLFNEKNYKNYKKITFENYDYVYKNWNDILRNSGIQA